MTTYNTVLEDRQYRQVAKKAAKYYQERAKMVDLPLIVENIPDAIQYRHTRLTDPRIAGEVEDRATGGVEQWEEEGDLADVQHGYDDYNLGSIQMNLKIMNANINQYIGTNLLADKKEAKISKFAIDVDDGLFHGVWDRTNDVKLCGGYQDHAGWTNAATKAAVVVANLNGTNSKLTTKGDIWKAIIKIIDTIPFAMREEGPDMIMLMSEHVYKTAKAPDRIYQDKVEWDFIYDNLIGPEAIHARKIGRVHITNKVLIPGTDVLTTNDRIYIYVPDIRWIAKVVSRSFSLLGEKQGMLSVKQAWGWRGACCIFHGSAAQMSDKIVWV